MGAITKFIKKDIKELNDQFKNSRFKKKEDEKKIETHEYKEIRLNSSEEKKESQLIKKNEQVKDESRTPLNRSFNVLNLIEKNQNQNCIDFDPKKIRNCGPIKIKQHFFKFKSISIKKDQLEEKIRKKIDKYNFDEIEKCKNEALYIRLDWKKSKFLSYKDYNVEKFGIFLGAGMEISEQAKGKIKK